VILPGYRSNLVTTDLTPHAKQVFKRAVILGTDSLKKLERSHQQDALQKIREELEAFAKAELAGHPEELKRFAGVDIRIGDPVEQILVSAEQLAADLLVMGTHSKGMIEHDFPGSVADKVLHRIRLPTFVIPLPKD